MTVQRINLCPTPCIARVLANFIHILPTTNMLLRTQNVGGKCYASAESSSLYLVILVGDSDVDLRSDDLQISPRFFRPSAELVVRQKLSDERPSSAQWVERLKSTRRVLETSPSLLRSLVRSHRSGPHGKEIG